MPAAEKPAEDMTRKDYIRLAIWLACWSAGFWLLEYARFAWHNPLGLLAYVLGVAALCERSKADGTSAQEE